MTYLAPDARRLGMRHLSAAMALLAAHDSIELRR